MILPIDQIDDLIRRLNENDPVDKPEEANKIYHDIIHLCYDCLNADLESIETMNCIVTPI